MNVNYNIVYLTVSDINSHLLYYWTRAKPIWDRIKKVVPGDDNITHDFGIFGFDRDNVSNHLLSIIVYYLYKDGLVCVV